MQYESMTQGRSSLPVRQKVSRMQKKGQVTIPGEIREKLGLKEGDLIAFVETEEGILLNPQEVIATKALERIGELLQEEEVSLEELIASGRDIRGEIINEQYGFTEG